MDHNKKLYFIAVVPPSEIQSDITKIKHYFADHYNAKHALKSPPHITLIPPFLWPEKQEIPLIKSLDEFCSGQPAADVELDGFNSFPPRVIYIDVKKNENLEKLFRNLITYLEEKWEIKKLIRFADRFHAHMSVAFRDLARKSYQTAWKEFQYKQLHYRFTADKLVLLKHLEKSWKINHESGLD